MAPRDILKEESRLKEQQSGLTLEEAMAEPRKHRDMEIALEPMPNFKSTPGSANGCPLSFWASWELNSRPRRIALLLDDCQEEYRSYAEEILPNLVKLTSAFRGKQTEAEDVPCIVWSSWSRSFDDGISNAMDRWYGPRGLNPKAPENAVYIFGGTPGLETLKEIAPTEQELDEGCFYLSKHLDMFWSFREDGKSFLDEKLKAAGVDTIVLTGLWTDECILSTAFAGSSRGYDVVVVSDAVATATAQHEKALSVINGTCGKVLTTDEVVSYMENEFVVGKAGAVKGTTHPDGRKE